MFRFIFHGTYLFACWNLFLMEQWLLQNCNRCDQEARTFCLTPLGFGLALLRVVPHATRINSDKAEVHTSLGGLLASEANFSCFGLLAVAEKRIRKYSHAYWTGKEIQRSSCDTHLSIRWAQILPAQDLEQDPCSVLRAWVRTASALQYTAACLVASVNFFEMEFLHIWNIKHILII